MVKYCLLQARSADDPVRRDELSSFAAQLGVTEQAIRPHDLLEDQTNLEAVRGGVDAVLIGGSGQFSLTEPEPWFEPFFETLRELVATETPTFGSCFGFQGLTVALGGEVRHDMAAAELGGVELQLNAAGSEDPLLEGLPRRFIVQQGHKDRAVSLPASATLLAGNERCPFQAMRVGSGLIYATQFHPELDHRANLERFLRYFEEYCDVYGRERAEEMRTTGFPPSPHGCAVLRRFGELVSARR